MAEWDLGPPAPRLPHAWHGVLSLEVQFPKAFLQVGKEELKGGIVWVFLGSQAANVERFLKSRSWGSACSFVTAGEGSIRACTRDSLLAPGRQLCCLSFLRQHLWRPPLLLARVCAGSALVVGLRCFLPGFPMLTLGKLCGVWTYSIAQFKL